MIRRPPRSTLSSSSAASDVYKRQGLRSYDREMPEEHNRVVIDHVADLLFTTCRDADENLLREGVPAERIRFVGNTMIDTLDRLLPAARTREEAVRRSV